MANNLNRAVQCRLNDEEFIKGSLYNEIAHLKN